MVFHASATHPENGVVILLEPGMTWFQLDCSRAIIFPVYWLIEINLVLLVRSSVEWTDHGFIVGQNSLLIHGRPSPGWMDMHGSGFGRSQHLLDPPHMAVATVSSVHCSTQHPFRGASGDSSWTPNCQGCMDAQCMSGCQYIL